LEVGGQATGTTRRRPCTVAGFTAEKGNWTWNARLGGNEDRQCRLRCART